MKLTEPEIKSVAVTSPEKDQNTQKLKPDEPSPSKTLLIKPKTDSEPLLTDSDMLRDLQAIVDLANKTKFNLKVQMPIYTVNEQEVSYFKHFSFALQRLGLVNYVKSSKFHTHLRGYLTKQNVLVGNLLKVQPLFSVLRKLGYVYSGIELPTVYHSAPTKVHRIFNRLASHIRN